MEQTKTIDNKIPFVLLTIFLECFFLQLLNFPYKIYILSGLLICLYLVIQHKQIWVDWKLIFLSIAMIGYVLVVDRGMPWGITVFMLPVEFYYIGKGIIKNSLRKENVIRFSILVMLIGYSVHGILNSIIFLRKDFVGGRAWEDVWTNTIVPGTQHAIYYLPVMALLFPAVFYIKKRKFSYTMILFCNIFFVYISLAALSRTPLIIMATVLIGQIALAVISNRKQKMGKSLYCGILALIGLIIVMVIIIMNTRFGQIFGEIMSRDGGIFNNIRFKAQIEAITQLFDYPMGGYHMQLAGLDYAHNVWLDLANAAGIIPFLALAGYTLGTIWDLIKFLRTSAVTQEIKHIVSGVYLAFFLYYMVEPALEATVVYLIPWIFLNGMVSGYNIKDNKKEF